MNRDGATSKAMTPHLLSPEERATVIRATEITFDQQYRAVEAAARFDYVAVVIHQSLSTIAGCVVGSRDPLELATVELALAAIGRGDLDGAGCLVGLMLNPPPEAARS
jgi:fructose 1,6-bisphosphatase